MTSPHVETATGKEERAQLLVPSLADGYQYSLIRLYECQADAARLGLSGMVAESGMFKGGTTMFLSRVIARLGASWWVFDTFGGFPPGRSRRICTTTQTASSPMKQPYGAILTDGTSRLSPGTCRKPPPAGRGRHGAHLHRHRQLHPRQRGLKVVRERTVPGGAIVFDHFTGTDRFRYTLGERIVGRGLLDDPRWLHLHGTGVFYRQQTAR